jgi:hypothetical protein
MSKSGLMMGAECANCGCKPCQACDAACDDTPSENFDTVYQANDTDGVLSWSGDAMGPIDGPFPGFEGSGVFYQQIELDDGASITLPGSRFPCYANVRFWRSIPGGTGSEDLVSNRIVVRCVSGRIHVAGVEVPAGKALVIANDGVGYEDDEFIVREGDSPVLLVAGEFDQSGNSPFWPISIVAVCSPAEVSVSAYISWENPDIQHALYGELVECFVGDCEWNCSGVPTTAPNEFYLNVTNVTGDTISGFGSPEALLEGSWVLGNYASYGYSGNGPCLYHWHTIDSYSAASGGIGFLLTGSNTATGIVRLAFQYLGEVVYADISEEDFKSVICGSSLSGSVSFVTGNTSLDWELST